MENASRVDAYSLLMYIFKLLKFIYLTLVAYRTFLALWKKQWLVLFCLAVFFPRYKLIQYGILFIAQLLSAAYIDAKINKYIYAFKSTKKILEKDKIILLSYLSDNYAMRVYITNIFPSQLPQSWMKIYILK